MAYDEVTNLKNQGNQLFREGKKEEAVEKFSEALKLDPKNHVLFSNRSAVRLSMGEAAAALEDAVKCVELKPDWPRGYQRKGAAQMQLSDLDGAMDSFQRGLGLDANDAGCKRGLAEVQQTAGMMGMAQLLNNAAMLEEAKNANPEVATALADAECAAKVKEIQENPKAIGKHLNDAKLMSVLNGLTMVMMQKMQGDMMANREEEEKRKREAEEKRKREEEEQKKREEEEERKRAEAAMTDEQREAAQTKEKGNEHFRAKEWAKARECYGRAKELDPENIVYRLNLAAAMLMMGDAEECLSECDEAVEKGRSVYASYDLIAKALHRKGRAFLKLNRLEDAVAAFQDSLTENRTAAALNDLRRTERTLEDRRKREYINPEISAEEKAKGTEAFRNGDIPVAVKHFSEAIKRNPTDHTLYSNRALAYTRLAALNEALADANECIKLEPTFIKGYLRKAAVYSVQKQYHRCMAIYREALAIDEDSVAVKEAMQQTLLAIQRRRASGEVDEKAREIALADPEIQKILATPEVQNFIREAQQDPVKANEGLAKRPALAEQIETLMAAGVI